LEVRPTEVVGLASGWVTTGWLLLKGVNVHGPVNHISM